MVGIDSSYPLSLILACLSRNPSETILLRVSWSSIVIKLGRAEQNLKYCHLKIKEIGQPFVTQHQMMKLGSFAVIMSALLLNSGKGQGGRGRKQICKGKDKTVYKVRIASDLVLLQLLIILTLRKERVTAKVVSHTPARN